MKIPLNVNRSDGMSALAEQNHALGNYLLAAKRGDWDAKHAVVHTFTPLIRTMATRRTTDTTAQNALIEAGKQGLLDAIKKYRVSQGADRFQLFALDFIEARMNKPASVGGGFLARLFGHR